MALEMRVYDEITDVNPKILLGLTGRQLVVVAVWLLIGVPISLGMWWIGAKEYISWVFIVIAAPGAVFGWVRPLGLPAEVYLRHIWGYLRRPRLLTYRNTATWSTQQHHHYEGEYHVSK